MRYRVEIQDAAYRAILEQARYIAVEARAPLNAERWLERVFDSADTLEHFPRRCPLAPEDANRPYEVRCLDVDGFLLLFNVDDEHGLVRVLSARHGRQLPRPGRLPPV